MSDQALGRQLGQQVAANRGAKEGTKHCTGDRLMPGNGREDRQLALTEEVRPGIGPEGGADYLHLGQVDARHIR